MVPPNADNTDVFLHIYDLSRFISGYLHYFEVRAVIVNLKRRCTTNKMKL